MGTISAPALSLSQNGKFLHVVKLNVAQLKELYREDPAASTIPAERKGLVIDRYNPLLDPGDSKQGYQRNIELNRARKFAAYLKEEGALSPTAILINDREGHVTFDPKTLMLTIDSDKMLFLFDGQHRTLGYLLGLADNPALAHFEIIAIITVGLDKVAEMRLFNIVNSRAKGVPTNLVTEILTEVYKKEGGSGDMPVGDRRKTCNNLALHILNENPNSPWFKKLLIANTKKPTRAEITANPELRHERMLGSASFLTSLAPVYTYLEQNGWPNLPEGNLEERAGQIAKIIDEFWLAIQDLMPEPFEDPQKYVLQADTVGCLALHYQDVLPNLMGRMYKARRDWVRDEFTVMLNQCDWFTDEQLWRKDNPQGASPFTGKPGMTKLAAIIKKDLFEDVASFV